MNQTESVNEGRIERETDETWRDRDMGVTVRREVCRRDGEEQCRLVVFGTRSDRYGSLDGDKVVTNERQVKIAEFSEAVATEVLFGLAEAHGYDLEPR